MRAISRTARRASEQIDNGSPIASTTSNASLGTACISTISATISVPFDCRGPIAASLDRTCSIIAAA